MTWTSGKERTCFPVTAPFPSHAGQPAAATAQEGAGRQREPLPSPHLYCGNGQSRLSGRWWCQQLPKSVDRARQKLFLPPQIRPACQRFCDLPAGYEIGSCPQDEIDGNVTLSDQQEPHHFEHVCLLAYGPELDHRDCPPQPSSIRPVAGQSVLSRCV